jgi:hypothetical protein
MSTSKPSYATLLARYQAKHGKLHTPASLHSSLWLAFSMALERSYYSVGTYADKPLDHGYYPSRAFDIRRKGWLGLWGVGFIAANRFAQTLWDNHEALNIDYVIVGRKIISRAKPYWHSYESDHSHDWHIHVSGWWPGKAQGVSGGPRPGKY